MFRAGLISLLSGLAISQADAQNTPDTFLYAQANAEYYILSRLDTHAIVLLGEAHFVRQDEILIRDVIEAASPDQLAVFASELWPAHEQELIDRIVSAPEWDRAAAIGILRRQGWPFEDYLALMETVWRINRDRTDDRQIRFIGLGVPGNWREAFAETGQTYDGFMADRLLAIQAETDGPILAQMGYHHAFTRYYMPDGFTDTGRVARFADRTGNRLYRELGQRVFMISLHASWNCFDGRRDWRCLPIGGAVDCAARSLDRSVGFDTNASPFANLPVTGYFYTPGQRGLEFGDMSDGYVWHTPLAGYQSVSLIPAADYVPDDDALSEARTANPFGEGFPSSEAFETIWRAEAEEMADYLDWRRWPEDERSWASRCGD